MNKKIFTTLALSILLTVSACGANAESIKQEQEISHIDDYGVPYATNGRLHKVNVKEDTNRVLSSVVNGLATTEYSIVYNASEPYCIRAASFIAAGLANVTGADFPLYADNDLPFLPNAKSKIIFVGSDYFFEYFGLTMPEDELGISGYYIKSKNDMVFIQVNHFDGYQQAAIHFLNYAVGWDMIVEDTVISSKDGRTLPTMDIVERPDYELANATNKMTSTTTYGLGYTTHYPFLIPTLENGNGLTWHNIHNFVDATPENAQNHPDWFADNPNDLCYSAHDNQAEFELMVEEAFKTVKRTADTKTDCEILNITQLDVPTCCTCPSCVRHKEQDGSIAGTMIRFMNAVDDKLQAYLEQKALQTGTKKREMYIQFFAYLATSEPPTTPVSEDPTLKCNPHVMVCIAPLHANYTKSFYDKENETFANNIIQWSKYCDRFSAWLYECNYHHYMYPYNTYQTMMENYRFCKEHGATLMLNEGQRFSANVTCFGKLKEYLCSKANFDVNVSYNELTDKWFEEYFLDAASIMREYYEQMRSWETYLESKPEEYGLGGGVYEEIGSKAEYWPKQMLLNWLEMMNQAEKTISKYKNTDPSLYQKLHKHILIETLFPRFALCDLHASTYSTSEIRELRLAFKQDATELGVVEFAEHDKEKDGVNNRYASWGI